jgi:hypothetical protein
MCRRHFKELVWRWSINFAEISVSSALTVAGA